MVNADDKPVGIIGVGTMGGAICSQLIKDGYKTVVYDSDPTRLQWALAIGSSAAASAAEVAEACNVALVIVENDSQVREAIAGNTGLLQKLKKHTTVIIHSTVSPETCRHCASLLRGAGAKLLDAAMSGGQVAINTRKLTLLVGGKAELLEDCRVLLGSYSDKIFLMGEVGMGMVAKLCNNAILQANRLALYEAIRLAQTAGIDPQSFVNLVKVSSGRSWVTDRWEELDFMVLTEGMGEHSMLRQMKKDLNLAIELSHSLDVPMTVAELAVLQLPDLIRFGLFRV